MNRPFTDEEQRQVADAIADGSLIQAIYLYRQMSGVGLAEAKAAVEAIEAEMRRTSPERFAMPSPLARGVSGPLSDAQHQQVCQEIAAGRKISAIKLYREGTGLGLAEAKDAVEALEAQMQIAPPGTLPAASPAAPRAVPAISEALRRQLADEVAAGRKIQAIRLYRETTGCGLAESKEAVEAILAATPATAQQQLASQRGGCLAAVLWLSLPVMAALAWQYV